ncbi:MULTISPECIES: serine hydrolase domain-containing protein [Bacillaceae]|uniref:Beta-lactamase family protein n=1 Tax=Evansella alkalicola TaxID=745819 RepID=A0ABS6JV60_9BACI|nr:MULTISPECIES: serine hydrolase [Bacillaceae]MBU9722434.1 beta-lactamase family protein [Bacillus alkalicola]
MNKKLNSNVMELVKEQCDKINFSGVILGKDNEDVLFESAFGFANRSDKLENNMDTRFGIASGCKIFTAVAICQLVEKGLLTFETKLEDCLEANFPHFDEKVTVHHLLTHTSGVPDYFDEAVMDDFEDLWKQNPMYRIKRLEDFLPLFQDQKMMFSPGEKFHYNNGGFILLGLIVESISRQKFQDYVVEHIFSPAEMKESGYFSFDCLPGNTALGYIDEEDGSWRTNIYSLPIIGGSDGGAFITAKDMIRFWEALLTNRLLKEDMTRKLLTPYAQEEVDGDEYYGYGVWISKKDDDIFKYHVMGYDPGVSFASSFYPKLGLKLVIPSNRSWGPHDVTETIEDYL